LRFIISRVLELGKVTRHLHIKKTLKVASSSYWCWFTWNSTLRFIISRVLELGKVTRHLHIKKTLKVASSFLVVYRTLVGLAYQGKDIVFRFIIRYSSLRDFGP
jgi:hypothetical protein